MPTRSFQEDLQSARESHQWPREQFAPNPESSPEPSEPRFVPSRSFSDYLEEAQLAKERPLPPDELERHRQR